MAQQVRHDESDNDLVGRVLGGDRAAYGGLVRRYQRAVRATIARVIRDPHQAEDAAQDTFVVAYEKLATLRSPGAFGAWLLSIAHRQAIRCATGRLWPVPLDARHEPAVPPAEAGFDNESQTLLIALNSLPEQERVVVMLRYFEDLDVAAIARITSHSVGTVTKQLSRAHQRLRTQLQPEQLP